MPSRVMIGVLISLAGAVTTLGWLWREAAEDAQAAESREAELAEEMETLAEESRRREKRAERLSQTLEDRTERKQELEEQLAGVKQRLNKIRENAKKENADESLRCAVRVVPERVDRLLRHED